MSICRVSMICLSWLAGAALVVALAGQAHPPSKVDRVRAEPNDIRLGPRSTGASIHALAHLEPAEGLVSVGSRPGVRVDRLHVKEGDRVEAGGLLATLEGREQAEMQLDLAKAKKRDSNRERDLRRERQVLERKQYDQFSPVRTDAAARTAQVARQRLQSASEIYAKIGQPLEKDPKARFDLDQTYFQLEQATIKAELEEKELQIEQELQTQRRSLEDRELADDRPGQEVLDRQIAAASQALADLEVRAPSSGRIVDLIAHAGEIGSGPLLVIGDDHAMVAIAEVYQSDVPRITPGDPAEVQVLDRKVSGKVLRIARMVGRNTLRSQDPRALQDLRVVRVTIALDDPSFAARFMNLQVDVTIRPGKGTSR